MQPYSQTRLKWAFEDELPDFDKVTYDFMFEHSVVRDGVRMFPYVDIDGVSYYLI